VLPSPAQSRVYSTFAQDPEAGSWVPSAAPRPARLSCRPHPWALQLSKPPPPPQGNFLKQQKQTFLCTSHAGDRKSKRHFREEQARVGEGARLRQQERNGDLIRELASAMRCSETGVQHPGHLAPSPLS
jgi:hypothetical protein